MILLDNIFLAILISIFVYSVLTYLENWKVVFDKHNRVFDYPSTALISAKSIISITIGMILFLLL